MRPSRSFCHFLLHIKAPQGKSEGSRFSTYRLVQILGTTSDDLIKNYTADTADPKDKAAIDFAVRLAKDSHSSSEQDFQALRELGFDDEEIMEIIAMSGMGVFYNHLANATKINIDEGFIKMISKK